MFAPKIGIDAPPLQQRGFVSAEGKAHNPDAKSTSHNAVQRTNYHAFFDDETKEMIAQRYAKDIEMFEYEY